jgi:hypothetical protein
MTEQDFELKEMDKTATQPTMDDLFNADTQTVESLSSELAEHIAREDDALDKLNAELSDRKARLDEAKEKLADILMQSGLDSIKLTSGLSPKVKINRRFFKAKGVDDDMLFGWLRTNQLEAIIKPTVHFQTLQSTLKAYEEQGNILPEIINAIDQKTITMYGKAKFLANH